MRAAGDPQGFHRRPLPGLRGAGHGGGLHPAHRRLPRRRATRGTQRPGQGAGHGRAHRGARPRGAGARAAGGEPHGGHQQPQPAHLRGEPADHAGAAAIDSRG